MADKPLVADATPAWATPGPTLYATLMEEALSTAAATSAPRDFFELVAPELRQAATGQLDRMLRTAYMEGVRHGYTEAVRRLEGSSS